MGFSKQESVFKTAGIGMLGGLTAAIAGQPFDTIKTRMQSSVKVKFTPRALYRGLLPPLLSVPPSWVLNFASFGAALKWTGDETAKQHFAAGSISGLCWAVTVTPFELVKCRAQRNNTTSTVEFKRIIEEKNRNPLKVLNSVYRGIPISFVRDCIGIGVWFAVYHITSTQYELAPFWCGGFSGLACWLTILPVDYVKTNYQIDTKATLQGSLRTAIGNIRGVWTGMSVIAVQQFVRTGCSMIVVEKAREYF